MKLFLKFIAVPLVVLMFFVQPVYAGGLIYDIQYTGGKTAAITLKWSDQTEKKGFAITHFFLKNGKVLNIGYTAKKDGPSVIHFTYDLSSAITPIRVNLTDIDDIGWVPFKDIKGIRNEEYIKHLYDAGIVEGESGGTFSPASPISREEVASIMVKALKLTGKAENAIGFKDIDKSWAKKDILLCVKQGIISGYSDKTFRPAKNITVAEVSSIISKSFKFKTVKDGIYDKLKQNEWYSSLVKNMFDTGIIREDDELYSNFDEDSHISRGDFAMMVSRALSTY